MPFKKMLLMPGVLGFLILAMLPTMVYSQWTNIGYGQYAGQFNALASSGSTLLAGSRSGGVWRSTDGGTSWSLANSGLTNLTVNTLAAIGGNFIAGTVTGVFRSSDGGVSWTSSGPAGAYIASFQILGGKVFAATTNGVLVSVDNGVTWSNSSNGLNGGTFGNALTAIGSSLYFGTTNGDVYLSIDDGANWTKKSTPTNFIVSMGALGSRLFVTTQAGIQYSDDQGATFVNSSSTLSAWAFVSSGTDIFAATTSSGMWVSHNNGASWQSSSSGMTSSIINFAAVVGTDIFAATNDAGLFKSSDSGATWVSANAGILKSAIVSLFVNGSDVFAGAFDNAYHSLDGGANWTAAASGLNGVQSLLAFSRAGSFAYAGTYNQGLFVSADGGTNWSPANNGISQLGTIHLAMKGATVYAANSSGLYSSSDNAASWQLNSFASSLNPIYIAGNTFVTANSSTVFYSTDAGVTWSPRPIPNLFPNVFAIAAGVLYCGTDMGLYKSVDTGLTWTQIGAGVFRPHVMSMVAGGADVFVSMDAGEIYMVSGESYTLMSEGLPINSGVTSLAFDNNILYAGVANIGTNYGSIFYHSTAFPAITSLSTTQGKAGDIITITGKNFNPAITGNVVEFNDKFGTVLSATSTTLTVAVPATFGKAKIKVTAYGRTAQSDPIFSIIPAVAGVSPQKGYKDTFVTISGSGFDQNDVMSVRFNTPSSVSAYANDPGTIYTTVPQNATTGPLSVVRRDGTVITSSVIFEVLPRIENFGPTSGQVGTDVTITGSGFGTTSGENTVLFNGVPAQVKSVFQNGSIVVTVPPGATSGGITVTVGANTATSETSFILLPLAEPCFHSPPKPVITVATQAGIITLTSSSNTGNQWYINDIQVTGAAAKSIQAKYSGIYTTRQVDLGCTGPISDAVAIVVTGLEPSTAQADNFEVFPNPARSEISIRVQSPTATATIINAVGAHVGMMDYQDGALTADISGLAPGIYFVSCNSEGRKYTAKFIKQ